MKRTTTITLTIAGLLAMAGIFYAANPGPFASLPAPIGVAAAGTDLIATEYCSQNLDKIDCLGNVSVLATIPGPVGPCLEKYVAIAPAQSANAVPPWSPRDFFVTQGTAVYKVTGSSATLFATIPGCSADHTGITFDHFGTFGYNMIVTCESGQVSRVNSTGVVTPITNTGTQLEGPAVPPPSFGPLGGQILAADENHGKVHAIASDGTVTYNVFDWFGAEAVHVIPPAPCTFCSGGSFFQAIENFGSIYQYAPADFAGLGGNIVVTSEYGAGVGLMMATFNGSSYDSSFFQNIAGGVFEGSSFADPDVPAPTPTATATATATPTATATATATPMQFFTSFVIGNLDAVVGNHVTFWGAQWWKLNHLSRGGAPASFKGFANSPNPNPPTCGGTWQSDPGNSSGPPPSVPADIIVIVSSLITKSGPVISGDVPMMVIVHTDPGYSPNPGHEGTGTVTAVVCR